MIGTVFKVLLALLTIALWVAVFRFFGIDVLVLLAPFINVIFGGVAVALLAWSGWRLFKAGYATKRSEPNDKYDFRVNCAVLLFFLFALAAGISDGFLMALPLTAVFAGACALAAPKLAQTGIGFWEKERREIGTSTLYGGARFIIFDGDLDHTLFDRLRRPLGSGPFLGFFEADLFPTFFHKLLLWSTSLRSFLARQLENNVRAQPLIYDGPSHLLTIGPARAGKGSCVIIPNLLTLERSVICIDPKGENAAVTRRKRAGFGPVHLLNPFDEHGMGTARFNPLAALDIHGRNVVADAAGLAEALIISDSKEPFFSDSARDLVRALILHLVATEGNEATLPEMRRWLTLAHGEGENDKFGILIFEMMQSPYPFISQPATRFQHADKTTQSIISTAITQTSFLDDPSIAHVLSGNDFSIKDFKKETSTLYIILPSRYLTAYARFFRLVVVSALDQLTSVPGGNRITMLLDEFAQLGHLSSIETAFGLAAGYNVQLWPFLQDLNQLKDIYKARWETFLSNAGVVQWFAPNDMTTADYLSKRLGNRTATTTSKSGGNLWARMNAGTSTTKGETGVSLQSPQDLMAMDKNPPTRFHTDACTQILNVSGIDLPIRCLRAAYYSRAFSLGGQHWLGFEELQGFYDNHNKPLFDDNPFHA